MLHGFTVSQDAGHCTAIQAKGCPETFQEVEENVNFFFFQENYLEVSNLSFDYTDSHEPGVKETSLPPKIKEILYSHQ